mmetsp:Transcript_32700/g.70118  ORF Transcript_32700/g.70118 Transcript_32700/m.70118 type:complete len:250 (+) Transcript_32700:2485-3234(+)
MTRTSTSPKASIFCPSGVFSSSSLACCTLAWILPISVDMPVETTMHRPDPPETVVPEKSMLRLSAIRALTATGCVCFMTVSLSPVSDPSSVRMVVDLSVSRRTSAGILSPTATSTMSPGTSSDAGSRLSSPLRVTFAVHVCRFLSASSAFSALCSCQTPTTALMTRMSKMTNGSTNAGGAPSSESPSKNARTKERMAAPSRILTSRSSNCCSTSFQSGVPSSLSSSLIPNLARDSATPLSLNPVDSSTP